MKKIAIVTALVLLAIIIFLATRRPASQIKETNNQQKSETATKLANLPAGWTTVTNTDTTIKLEKTVTSGLKPEVVFKQTSSKDATVPAKYVDNLKAGARATLSGLIYSTDKRNSNDTGYSALLTGYYLNKGKKIYLDQRLYLKDETVYTFSGSSDSNLTGEVSQVLNSLVQEKIGL